MKYVVVLCLILTFSASADDLPRVRQSFHNAVLNTDKITEFYQLMEHYEMSGPVFKAYKAVSEALVAQLEWNPYKKYLQVEKFNTIISEALRAEPDNLEIRFLRLCVEYHLPGILMMSDHMKEDVAFIMKNLSRVDTLDFDRSFTRYILVFMEETGLCEVSQLNEIKAKLAAQ
ncbi:MAG: hypothetical protein OEY56_08630 [Cyclobacteriaceae bacterium]|nr:hypothetical protein [Cyclobacteriaceae bacterium]